MAFPRDVSDSIHPFFFHYRDYEHMPSQPPSGFAHLVLLSQENPVYLKIPTAIVATVCLSPRKYLGWRDLGVIGVLEDEQGNRIALNGELVDKGVYQYIFPDDQDVLAHAVDLEVVKQRTHVPSEATRTTKTFAPSFWNAIVVASGPAFRRRLGCISSCTDEVIMTRHVQ